ncbi:MAG TPA: FAD-binding and (Fe-S)-binding domain-containing protein [Phenylobacterium sp.]|nr:FAD-binding and (Fe-S)-binding domain-containing protein [Phenylobacterium sp.]
MRTVIDRTASGRVAAEGVILPETQRLELGRALADRIEGEVRFGDGDRALYATDASNYRQLPMGLVLPKSAQDVVATLELCRAFDAPVTPRGGGTSLAGQTCNTAVLLDFSKYMHRLLALDPAGRRAEVEPGCILDHLRGAAERHHLTFGPDPATHSRNTLGGMIGNDSCGGHSLIAGRTADNVEWLEVVTYRGLRMTLGPTSRADYEQILKEGGPRADLYRGMRALWDRYGAQFERTYPQIPRRVSGYENLDQLAWDKGFNVARALVGTEAGCAVVLKAGLRLIESPPKRVLALLGFADICAAADAVCGVLEHGPISLEAFDQRLVDDLKTKRMDTESVADLPPGGGWLMAEFGADSAKAAAEQAKRLVAAFRGKGCAGKVLSEPAAQARLWKLREDALAATAIAPGVGRTFPGWEDSAVRREDLGRYLRDLRALFDRFGYQVSIYGHFGDGLVHCRVEFDMRSEQGLRTWQAFLDAAADLVVRYGGSLSGEHGDGQARGALLEKMYGPELMAAQREFKALWDPDRRMNPGKVLEPYPITANLRAGPDYHPPRVQGEFAYPQDGGDFAVAMERCVGVGACRRTDSDEGVMCPSFMATREEQHSTRGRARLLFEMMHGGAITDGWRSRAVEAALDLCLACKGCKSDCPVGVDMATYKAEFRAHHYAGRLRPRAAYAMGQIRRWSEIGRRAPWLANAILRTPGLAAAAKAAGGLAQARTVPAFAPQSFRAWWRRRQAPAGEGPRVMLWPDTFNDVFRPETAIAAVRLLEGLGYRVEIPRVALCCGRPLYDWGWIDQARGLWRRTLAALADEIAAGVPVVGLEPACVSAFRDELPGLFPDDEAAKRLSAQTLFLTEFLDREGRRPELADPPKVLVQTHCHQHAVLDAAAERRVLQACGVEAEVLASGCCGMAGAFGFEAAKYPVSMAAAERVLLPAVRAAPQETLILANGFSCREQIEQGTGRGTVHVAELMARAFAAAEPAAHATR